MDSFGDYDFDTHPFAGLGGYDQAARVFGGTASLDRLIASVNAAVFGGEGAGHRRREGREGGSDVAAGGTGPGHLRHVDGPGAGPEVR